MTEMDELICRVIEGRASDTEARQLLAWRRASRIHEAHYQELHHLLQAVESSVNAEPVPPPPPVHRVIDRGRHREAAASRRRQRVGRWLWGAGGVAAAVAAAILVVLFNPLAKPEITFGKGEFVTGAAESATVVLADGTVVRLAPDSRLRIPGVPGSREVFLDGQAFFAVAKMSGHPFRVRTRSGDAHVLGTRFEVRTDDETVRVVVLEGRVALEAGADRVEVDAGEMSLISKGTTSAPIKVEDVRPLVPWLERFIVFQSTPLREVVVELERQYGTRIELADSALADLEVTGWYADKSFEEVVAVVCGVVRAECAVQDSVAYIKPRRSGPGAHSNRPRGELHISRAEER